MELRPGGPPDRVVKGCIYYVPGIGIFRITIGFQTDYASTPHRSPWDARYAAVLHDFLYQHPAGLDRAMADRAFLLVLRDCDRIGVIRRVAMYRAVRAFGGAIWARYRKADHEKR